MRPFSCKPNCLASSVACLNPDPRLATIEIMLTVFSFSTMDFIHALCLLVPRVHHLLADEFPNVPVRSQLEHKLRVPRLRVSLRIFNRDVVLQRVVIHAMDPLHEVQLIAVRMTVSLV